MFVKPFGWFYSFVSFIYSLDRLELVTILIIALLCKLNFPRSRHILITVAPKLVKIFSSKEIFFFWFLVLVRCPPRWGWLFSYFFIIALFCSLIFQLFMHILFGTWQKVVQISCGWRHSLAVTEKQNVFSWGRGTNGQLGHGESVDR